MRELLEARISNTLFTVNLLFVYLEFPIDAAGLGFGAGLSWEDDTGIFGFAVGSVADGRVGRSF